jgi:hypothetical protein
LYDDDVDARTVEASVVEELPREWIERAFLAYNGEMAWRLSDIHEVVRLLAAANRAVLGGEIWLVRMEGERWTDVLPPYDASPRPGYRSNWYGIIPQAEPGRLPCVYVWEYEQRWNRASETWSDFCARAADYTISVVAHMHPEEDVPEGLSPRLRYNLSYETQQEYEQA